MSQFIFDGYNFDPPTGTASFRYRFEDGRTFEEKVVYQPGEGYDEQVLDRALFLAFILIGTSYFKTFPTPEVAFATGYIDSWQADFLNHVYGEGLSQFAYENKLTRAQLAQFAPTVASKDPSPLPYQARGTLVLQSGGKDSLLTAALLNKSGRDFAPWHLANSDHYPKVLTELGYPLVLATRAIDIPALKKAADQGGLNGHVPITYIVQSLALIQAILTGKNEVLVSVAHEGEEAHAQIGDLPVTHQWSKSWHAEQLFAEYVRRYISGDIRIGSPLRQYSELRVAELFAQEAWQAYGHRFSSCNRANYMHGTDNSELFWCGECPKCANAYLLFAPFVEAGELKSLFRGQDLFAKPELEQTFKGLLGIDGVMKPFECIGEIEELRLAYGMARKTGGYAALPFAVPAGTFDYLAVYPSQDWARL